MFTVKFFRADADEEQWNHISCPHYAVEKHSNGTTTVICYKDMTSQTGVEFQIRPGAFDACFVENSTGKTIDKHRARAEHD